jgi:hypothetical protein
VEVPLIFGLIHPDDELPVIGGDLGRNAPSQVGRGQSQGFDGFPGRIDATVELPMELFELVREDTSESGLESIAVDERCE